MEQPGTIYDDAGIERFRKAERLDPFRLRRLRYKYFRLGRPVEEALEELPSTAREPFARQFAFHTLQLIERSDSNLDGATKLLFETRGGRRLESVLLRAPKGRTTVCVSSQVGCAARCGFCATGYLAEATHLTAAEIVDQVAQADRIASLEGRRVRNVVFMGMGEPFHNEQHLFDAVERMHRDDWTGIPLRRTVVSTVGVPDGMIRWAKRYRRSGLALSLHSADQEFRERLIPLARKYSLRQLRETVQEVTEIQGQAVLIEYLMLRGLNDRDEDARRLADYLRGLRVHVNLIPFNPISEAPQFAPTPRADRERFGQRLRELGFTVTIRYSQGNDIAAACGQLARRKAV